MDKYVFECLMNLGLAPHIFHYFCQNEIKLDEHQKTEPLKGSLSDEVANDAHRLPVPFSFSCLTMVINSLMKSWAFKLALFSHNCVWMVEEKQMCSLSPCRLHQEALASKRVPLPPFISLP